MERMNGYDSGVHLPNPNADKANAQQGKSLEVLLATKGKRIQEELTKFRVRPPIFLFVAFPLIPSPLICFAYTHFHDRFSITN